MLLSRLKQLLLSLRLTRRIYIGTVLVIIIPAIIISVAVFFEFVNIEQHDRGENLISGIHQLDRQFHSKYASFDDVLVKFNAANMGINEQQQVLRSILQPMADRVALNFPGLNFGFFCSDYDLVVGGGPDEELWEFAKLNSYQTGHTSTEFFDKSQGWNGKPVLGISYPIYNNGQIVGHLWANIDEKAIYQGALVRAGRLIGIGLGLLCFVMVFVWVTFVKLKNKLEDLVSAITEDRSVSPTGFFPEINPVLELLQGRTKALKEVNQQLQTEIQAKKMAMEKLTLFSYMVESSDDAIIGSRDGRIITWNMGAKNIFGYESDEVIGRPITLVVAPEGMQDVEEIRQKLVSGEKIQQKETAGLHKDGRIIDVSLTVSVVKDEAGKSIGASCIARDITDRKELEREMTRIERLNLVGEMAAGIGHEIRNPMTTVRGFLQLLGTKEQCLPFREHFEVMISELDRANQIITEFLSLARNKAVTLKQHNLNEIIRAIAPLIRAEAMVLGKGLVLELGEVPNLLLNEQEMRQVILNLAINGLEAMEADRWLTLRTYVERDEVVLAVEDQGGGIASEIIDKIGTPFFTTKDTGTGLGLAVCYSIAARHGASIKVKSRPGKTIFWMKFKMAS